MFVYAHQLYYPLDRVPQFWEWLLGHADAGRIKTPPEIHAEVDGKDELLNDWMKEHRDRLVLDDRAYQGLVGTVVKAYAKDITDAELEKIGKDPFLIAAGLQLGATVVTGEASKPSKQRANRRIPDVCDDLGVTWISYHELIKQPDLDFRIT